MARSGRVGLGSIWARLAFGEGKVEGGGGEGPVSKEAEGAPKDNRAAKVEDHKGRHGVVDHDVQEQVHDEGL